MDANLDLAEVPIGTVQPHVILPSQYFESRGRLTPEHRLRIAVLDDAIQCVEKYRFATNVRGQRRFHEARRWLLAEETDWPYSFEVICEVLDLDANAVRHRLRLARKRQPVSVSREMRMRTHERGTVVSLKSGTSVGSAPGVRSHTPLKTPRSNPQLDAQPRGDALRRNAGRMKGEK